jgi:hypothetical protein
MNPRERLLKVLDGSTADRTPIYTQIPFAVSPQGLRPGAFHGYADYDEWRIHDPLYWNLVRRMQKECDNPFIWRPPCMGTDQFFFSPANAIEHPAVESGDRLVIKTEVDVDGITYTQKKAVKPGCGHSWQTEHYCKSPDDARRLLDTPWVGHGAEIGDFHELAGLLGERGTMWVTIPSPLMVVCRLFDPMEFLVYVRTEEQLIDRLCTLAQERIGGVLETLLEAGAGPVVRFGGAEHATPPLMSPEDFDHYIVEYDTPLIELCKRFDAYVAYHCHGNLRHALQRFVEMGVDMTDPTETSPDGDVTLEEAREIAGDDIVLAGNIQCRELFSDSVPSEVIRDRTIELMKKLGPARLLVTTTGSVLEPISKITYDKYNVMIDTVLGY